jgi:hypothetical protein
MLLVMLLATLFLGLTIALLGGTIVRQLRTTPFDPARVEEIRRLRQEGLAMNQEGE